MKPVWSRYLKQTSQIPVPGVSSIYTYEKLWCLYETKLLSGPQVSTEPLRSNWTDSELNRFATGQILSWTDIDISILALNTGLLSNGHFARPNGLSQQLPTPGHLLILSPEHTLRIKDGVKNLSRSHFIFFELSLHILKEKLFILFVLRALKLVFVINVTMCGLEFQVTTNYRDNNIGSPLCFGILTFKT